MYSKIRIRIHKWPEECLIDAVDVKSISAMFPYINTSCLSAPRYQPTSASSAIAQIEFSR